MSSDKAGVQGKGHTSSSTHETDDVFGAKHNSVSFDGQIHIKGILQDI